MFRTSVYIEIKKNRKFLSFEIRFRIVMIFDSRYGILIKRTYQCYNQLSINSSKTNSVNVQLLVELAKLPTIIV